MDDFHSDKRFVASHKIDGFRQASPLSSAKDGRPAVFTVKTVSPGSRDRPLSWTTDPGEGEAGRADAQRRVDNADGRPRRNLLTGRGECPTVRPMSGMSPHPSALTIAKESMAMSRDSGCRVFQTVAMVSMVAMALASLTSAGHVLLRDLNKRYESERDQGRGR